MEGNDGGWGWGGPGPVSLWPGLIADGFTSGPEVSWLHPHHPLPLADDEKILVEPACGAALAAIYSKVIQKLQGEGKLCTPLSSVVVIVCGGNNISLAQLLALKKQLGMGAAQ